MKRPQGTAVGPVGKAASVEGEPAQQSAARHVDGGFIGESRERLGITQARENALDKAMNRAVLFAIPVLASQLREFSGHDQGRQSVVGILERLLTAREFHGK